MQNDNIISAFTEEQAASLTGLSVHQLRKWDRTNFFRPTLTTERDESVPYERVYSFKDLLSLQVLGALRNDRGVSLQHLRKVKEKLAHLKDGLWSNTTLYVLNKRVLFRDKENDELCEALTEQIVFPIPLEVVRSNMRTAIQRLNRRGTDEVGHIERKKIRRKTPVIAGTRIPVSTIKQFYDKGYTIDDILREFPSLTQADIQAAIRFSPEKTAA